MMDCGNCSSCFGYSACPERAGCVYDALERSISEYCDADLRAFEVRLYQHAASDCVELRAAVETPVGGDYQSCISPIYDMLAKDELLSRPVSDILRTWASGKTVSDEQVSLEDVLDVRSSCSCDDLVHCASIFVDDARKYLMQALTDIAGELVDHPDEDIVDDEAMRRVLLCHLSVSDVESPLGQSIASRGVDWVKSVMDCAVPWVFEVEMRRFWEELGITCETRHEGEERLGVCSDDPMPCLSELI